MKAKPLNRILAAVTLFVFAAGQIAWGEIPATPSLSPVYVDLDKIKIPSEIGSVQEVEKTKSDRTVILIQDAHSILDAQQNIQKLIRFFGEKQGVRAFAVEGSKDALDTTILKSFPDEFIKQKVMRDYLERGEMTGADLGAIFDSGHSVFYGLEDWRFYQENYLAYLLAVKNTGEIQKKIEEIKKSWDTVRARVYSADLNRFHETVENFRDEKTGLLELMGYLRELEDARPAGQKKIIQQSMPHLYSLLNVLAKESGRSENLSADISSMAQKFQNMFRFKLTLDSSREFNKRFQDYRTGTEDGAAFLKFMVETGKGFGYKPRLTMAMKELLGQAETMSMIKGTKLFDELNVTLKDYENTLAATREQKEMGLKYERLRLLGDLAKLELVRDQLDEYQKDPEVYLSLLGESRELMTPALKFYRSARERDDVFISKIRQILEKDKAGTVVVMAGGFHSEGLRANLKREGYSYMVLTPAMESLEGHENYMKVMTGDLSYREFLTTSFYDAFIRHSTLALVKEMNEPDFRKNLKLWRDQVIRNLADQGRISEAGEYNRYIDQLIGVYREKFGDQAAASKTRESVIRDMETILSGFADKTVIKVRDRLKAQLADFKAETERLDAAGQLTEKGITDLALQIEAKKAGVNTARPLGNRQPDLLTDVILNRTTLAEASAQLESVLGTQAGNAAAVAEGIRQGLQTSGAVDNLTTAFEILLRRQQGTVTNLPDVGVQLPTEEFLTRARAELRSAAQEELGADATPAEIDAAVDNALEAAAGNLARSESRAEDPGARFDRVMADLNNRLNRTAVESTAEARLGRLVGDPRLRTLGRLNPLPGRSQAQIEKAITDALHKSEVLAGIIGGVELVFDEKPADSDSGILKFKLLEKLPPDAAPGQKMKVLVRPGVTVAKTAGDGTPVAETLTQDQESLVIIRSSKDAVLSFRSYPPKGTTEEMVWALFTMLKGLNIKTVKFTNMAPGMRKIFNVMLSKWGYPEEIPEDAKDYDVRLGDLGDAFANRSRSELREAEALPLDVQLEDARARLAYIISRMTDPSLPGQGGPIPSRASLYLNRFEAVKAADDAGQLKFLATVKAFFREVNSQTQPRNLADATLLLAASRSEPSQVLLLLSDWFKTRNGEGELTPGIALAETSVKVELGILLLSILQETLNTNKQAPLAVINMLRVLDQDADFREDISNRRFEELDEIARVVTSEAAFENRNAQLLARRFSRMNFFRASFDLLSDEYVVMNNDLGKEVLKNIARSESRRAEPYKVYQEVYQTVGQGEEEIRLYARVNKTDEGIDYLALEAYRKGEKRPFARTRFDLTENREVSIGRGSSQDFTVPDDAVSIKAVVLKVEKSAETGEWILSYKNFPTRNPMFDIDENPVNTDDAFRPAPLVLRYSLSDSVEILSAGNVKAFGLTYSDSLQAIQLEDIPLPGTKNRNSKADLPYVIFRDAYQYTGELGKGGLVLNGLSGTSNTASIANRKSGDVVIYSEAKNNQLTIAGYKVTDREIRIRYDGAKSAINQPELPGAATVLRAFLQQDLDFSQFYNIGQVAFEIFATGLQGKELAALALDRLQKAGERVLLGSRRFQTTLSENPVLALSYLRTAYLEVAFTKRRIELDRESERRREVREIVQRAGSDADLLLNNYLSRNDVDSNRLKVLFAALPGFLDNLKAERKLAAIVAKFDTRASALETRLAAVSTLQEFNAAYEGLKDELDELQEEVGYKYTSIPQGVALIGKLRRLKTMLDAAELKFKRIQDEKNQAERASRYSRENKIAIDLVRAEAVSDPEFVKTVFDVRVFTGARGSQKKKPDFSKAQIKAAEARLNRIFNAAYGVSAIADYFPFDMSKKSNEVSDAFYEALERAYPARSEARIGRGEEREDSEIDTSKSETSNGVAVSAADAELRELARIQPQPVAVEETPLVNPAAFSNLTGLNNQELLANYLKSGRNVTVLDAQAEIVIANVIAPALKKAGINILDEARKAKDLTLTVSSDGFKAIVRREYAATGLDEILEIDGVLLELEMAPFINFSNTVQAAASGTYDSAQLDEYQKALQAYRSTLSQNETLVTSISDNSDVQPMVDAIKPLADAGTIGRLIVMHSSDVKIQQRAWGFIASRRFVPMKQGGEAAAVGETARKEQALTGEDISIVLTSLWDLSNLTDPAAQNLLSTSLGAIADARMKQVLLETAILISLRLRQLSPEERRRFKEDGAAFRSFLEREGFGKVAGSIGFGNKGFLQITVEQFVSSFKAQTVAAQAA